MNKKIKYGSRVKLNPDELKSYSVYKDVHTENHESCLHIDCAKPILDFLISTIPDDSSNIDDYDYL